MCFIWLSGKEFACHFRKRGFHPWVRKIPLRKEMATDSSFLAWEITRTEKTGRLQPMGVMKQSDTTEQLNNNKMCLIWMSRSLYLCSFLSLPFKY